MTDWETIVGPAVEHELLRQDGARRCYDTDPDFRAGLAMLADHLVTVAQVMDGQGFPRFSIDDLLRETIRRRVETGVRAAGHRERLARAQEFARANAGKPYVWGGQP